MVDLCICQLLGRLAGVVGGVRVVGAEPAGPARRPTVSGHTRGFGRGGQRRHPARWRSTHQGSSSDRFCARSAGTRRHFSHASHCTWEGRGGASRSVGGGGGAAAPGGGVCALWGGGAAWGSLPQFRGRPGARPRGRWGAASATERAAGGQPRSPRSVAPQGRGPAGPRWPCRRGALVLLLLLLDIHRAAALLQAAGFNCRGVHGGAITVRRGPGGGRPMHSRLNWAPMPAVPQCPFLHAHALCAAARPDRSSQPGAWRCSRASEGPAALPVLPGPLGASLAAHSDYHSRSAHQRRARPARALCRCRHCHRLPGSPQQSSALPAGTAPAQHPAVRSNLCPATSALSAPPFFPHCLLPVCGSLASSFEGWLGVILRSCTSQVALHSEGGHNGLLTVSHINQPWSELRCAALVLKTACLLLLPGAPMPRASRPDVWQARAAPRLGDSAALASDHPLHHEAVELHTASRAVRSAALARESRCRSCRRHSPPVWHAAPPLVQPAPHRLPHLCTHTGTHGPSSCGALRSALPPAGLPVRVRRLPCTAACSSAGCSHEQLGRRRPAASGRASGGRRLGAQPAAGCDAGA